MVLSSEFSRQVCRTTCTVTSDGGAAEAFCSNRKTISYGMPGDTGERSLVSASTLRYVDSTIVVPATGLFTSPSTPLRASESVSSTAPNSDSECVLRTVAVIASQRLPSSVG
jgi:hypothetical protein